MGTLDQVRLLAEKVDKAIAYVKRLQEENVQLREQSESYRQRAEELETLLNDFKEEQERIAEGILSAIERLNEFEDAVEKGLVPVEQPAPPAVKTESGSSELEIF
jgi:chromosome segregation ATPase